MRPVPQQGLQPWDASLLASRGQPGLGAGSGVCEQHVPQSPMAGCLLVPQAAQDGRSSCSMAAYSFRVPVSIPRSLVRRWGTLCSLNELRQMARCDQHEGTTAEGQHLCSDLTHCSCRPECSLNPKSFSLSSFSGFRVFRAS